MNSASLDPHACLHQLLPRLPRPPRSAHALRYRGDDRAFPLSQMEERDRAGVRVLYDMLGQLEASLRERGAESDAEHLAHQQADAFDLDGAVQVARSLGSGRNLLQENLRHVIHDVRGGALTSLLVEVSRARSRRSAGAARTLRLLTRAHLKVMRNAVLELDDARRTADLASKPHSVETLRDTLGQVTRDGEGGPTHVHVECSFIGSMTMSCVELGALDRCALNLVNNAVRHTSTARVEVALTHAATADGSRGDLCVAVANPIDPAHADALRERFGGDLGRLFLEPFSTTGSGDGLKICIDVVSAAFGLVRVPEAVESGLVGARLADDCFAAWIHWPAAG